MKYYYSDTEIKTLLQSMVVLCDTREQVNGHILQYFDKAKITYQTKKLDFADYSCMLPANKDMGIMRDVYFTGNIAIERKNSLDELASNISKERQRFESELLRTKGAGCRLYLMVEGGSWADISAGRYRSELSSKAYMATLMAYMARYGISVDFVKQEQAGMFILMVLHYYLREYLKGGLQVA